MTKKDYELIAAALVKSGEETLPECIGVWEHVVSGIANALASDNPRFDRRKFIAACRLSS